MSVAETKEQREREAAAEGDGAGQAPAPTRDEAEAPAPARPHRASTVERIEQLRDLKDRARSGGRSWPPLTFSGDVMNAMRLFAATFLLLSGSAMAAPPEPPSSRPTR